MEMSSNSAGSDSLSADPIGEWIDACLELPPLERERALLRLLEDYPKERSALEQRLQLLRDAGLLDGVGDGERLPDRLGNYRIVERLGGGGMGVVYAAIEEPLERPVALKILRPELQLDEGARRRFLREIDAVARLQHENIVPIYAAGSDNGVAYLAMQRVEGISLADLLTLLPARAPERIERTAVEAAFRSRLGAEVSVDLSRLGSNWLEMSLEIGRQVAEALEHAHGRAVVHRDVKPSNLMLTPRGRVLLLDFGLAQAGGSTRLTLSGSVMGSLAYMSPEQVRGDTHAIDARSDVYALGATLYELLCHEPPFPQRELVGLRAAILAGDPELPRRRVPSLTRDIDAVLLTALARDPARRYATAGAFMRDLMGLLRGAPVQARAPSRVERVARWCRRHPTLATTASIVMIVLVVGPTVFALQELRARHEIERELDRNAAHLGLIRGNLSEMLRGTYRDIAGLPGASALRARLLERARRNLAALEQQVSVDTPLFAELAGLHGLLGDLALEDSAASDGGAEEARKHYLQALEGWQHELERVPNSSDAELNLHALELRLARFYVRKGDSSEARTWMERARLGLEALVAREPKLHDARRELVATLGEAADLSSFDPGVREGHRDRLEAHCAELLNANHEDPYALHGLVTSTLRRIPDERAEQALPLLAVAESRAQRLAAKFPEHAAYGRLLQKARLERAKLHAAPPSTAEALALLVAIEATLAQQPELGADLEGRVLAFDVAFVLADLEALAHDLSITEIGDLWRRCFLRLIELPWGSQVQRQGTARLLPRFQAWLLAIEDAEPADLATRLHRCLEPWIAARRSLREPSELSAWRALGSVLLREFDFALGRSLARLEEAFAAGRARPDAREESAKRVRYFYGLLLQRAQVLHDVVCGLLPEEPALASEVLDPAAAFLESGGRYGMRNVSRFYVEYLVRLLRGSVSELEIARRETAGALLAAEAWRACMPEEPETEASYRAMHWRALVQRAQLCGPLPSVARIMLGMRQAQILRAVLLCAVVERSTEAQMRFAWMGLSASPELVEYRRQALALAPGLIAERASTSFDQNELSTFALFAFEIGDLAHAVELAERALIAYERRPDHKATSLDGLERRRELARYRGALVAQKSPR